MRTKFKKPIIGLDEEIDASRFKEKELRKTHDGRTYIKLIQEAIDKKFIKFKNVSQFLKNFVKKEVDGGVCVGQSVEILKAAKKYGVKKDLPKKVSRNAVLAVNCFDNLFQSLSTFSYYKEKNSKKGLKSVMKSSPYINKNVNFKKLDAYLEKAKIHPEEVDSKLNLSFSSEKKFSLNKKKQAIRYIRKSLKKDDNSYFLFNFPPKKSGFDGLSHVVSAGVNKKPFFYDANRGYRRFQNKKKFVDFIKKEYVTKKSKHIFDSRLVEIQHFKGK